MSVTTIIRPAVGLITATGGNVVKEWVEPETGILWKSHIFTANGDFVISSGTDMVEYLLIAGGGGGGGSNTSQNTGSGGGGAGGLLYGLMLRTPGTYAVVIGNGGSGGNTSGTSGGDGSNSTAFGLTAIGGGGAGGGTGVQVHGRTGGSGGSAGNGHGGLATIGQGTRGAYSISTGTGRGGGAGGSQMSARQPQADGLKKVTRYDGFRSNISGDRIDYGQAGYGGGRTSLTRTGTAASNPGSGGHGGDSTSGSSNAGGAGSAGRFVVRYKVRRLR